MVLHNTLFSHQPSENHIGYKNRVPFRFASELLEKGWNIAFAEGLRKDCAEEDSRYLFPMLFGNGNS